MQENGKTMKHENDGDTNDNWFAWYSHQKISLGTGGFGNERMSGDHTKYSIIKIDQNTEESPGNLRGLVVIAKKNFNNLQTFLALNYHHHHHVVPLARISLTLSRHFYQSFIASGRFSGLHSVSSQSCCMYVRAGRPAFARRYVGAHRSKSLTSSSLLLQLGPACLVRLA